MGEAKRWPVVLGAMATGVCAVALLFAAIAVFSMEDLGPVPDPTDYAGMHKMDVAKARWDYALAEAREKVDIDVFGGKEWHRVQAHAEEGARAMAAGDVERAVSAYERGTDSFYAVIREAQGEQWRIEGEAARDAWLAALAKAPPEATLEKYGGGLWKAACWNVKTVNSAEVDERSQWAAGYFEKATQSLERIITAIKAMEDCSITFSADGARPCVFSSDGKTIVTVHPGFGTVRRWNLSTGECIQTLREPDADRSRYTISRDGKVFARANEDGSLTLWDLSTGKRIQRFKGHEGRPGTSLNPLVHSLAFSPDGKMLASGGRDAEVKLWDTATGDCLRTLDWHWEPVWRVAFSPDGKTLASRASADPLTFWDVATGERLRVFADNKFGDFRGVFSPDSKVFVDFDLKVWSMATGDCLRVIKDPQRGLETFTISPDGKTLATGYGNGSVKLWDMATGDCFHLFKGHTGRVTSIMFSPDGKTIASSDRNRVMLWPAKRYEPGSAIHPRPYCPED